MPPRYPERSVYQNRLGCLHAAGECHVRQLDHIADLTRSSFVNVSGLCVLFVQVSLFLGGERDYLKIEGDTGPLVYPAGFLYVFSALRIATGGGQVFPAQLLFAILYLLNLAVVLAIYVWAGNVPIWAMSLLCLSKRYASNSGTTARELGLPLLTSLTS